MTITELIDELEGIRAEQGDCNVVVEHPAGYFNDPKVSFDGVDAVLA